MQQIKQAARLRMKWRRKWGDLVPFRVVALHHYRARIYMCSGSNYTILVTTLLPSSAADFKVPQPYLAL
jgi:hypothetical protein